MKKLLILLALCYCVNIVYATDPQSIRQRIVEFLLKRTELPENANDHEYKNCVRIFDLSTDQLINNPKIGVFRFCTCSAHAKFYIIIAGDKQSQILTLQFLDEDLTKIISYAEKRNIPVSITLKYIKNAILLYQWNEKINHILE
jgi:hypothetical protein